MAFVPVIGAVAAGVGYLVNMYRNSQEKEREEECKQKCKQLLVEIKEKGKIGNTTFRFLLFGITGHGKSTLCNGILSAYEEKENLADVFQSGIGGSTFTKGFCPCQLEDNILLIDMGGIFESNEIDIEIMKNVLEGRVPFYEQLGENLELLDTNSDYSEPESNDLACVVIVMKPWTVITEQLRKQFQAVDDCAARGRITRCLVVTHIDKIDPQFEDPKNLINIENSRKIKQCRHRLSAETGIPLTSISFVRNYWDEHKTNVYTNCILLEFFNQLMQSGIDAKRRAASRKELRNMSRVY